MTFHLLPLTHDLLQVFTLIFAAEMFLKLIAMNLDGYFRVRLPVYYQLKVDD